MKRSNKKGFTIVELVIVIAIIAILAAVLIPTFASLIQKANTSADIQACRQMNTYLAVNEVTADKTIVEVYEALNAGGMDAEDYKPLSSNTYYFWDAKLNRVLYTNDSYEVIYPEEYKDVKSTDADHQWYSLTTEIKEEEYNPTTDADGTVKITVKTGGELYKAVKDLAKNGTVEHGGVTFKQNITSNTVIELNNDIDMMGASLSIGVVKENVKFTIDGKSHKITGISNLEAAAYNLKMNVENKPRNYNSGLIARVLDGSNVTFKDITFENTVVGRNDIGSSAFLIGYATGNGTKVTFENVAIVNSTLYGKNKLGALIGAQCNGGVETIVKGDKTKFENVKIICTEGESGILFGSTSNSDGTKVNEKVKIDKTLIEKDDFIKNCSVTCTSSNTKEAKPGEGFNMTYDKKIVKKIDGNDYRVGTAYYGFVLASTSYPETSSKYNPINDYDQAVAAGWVYDFTTNQAVTANGN